MPLMSLNILCRWHVCTRLPLYISCILHKELSIAKWIENKQRYLYTRIIVWTQQSPSLLIDTGFNWDLSSFPSVIWYIDTCLPDALMVWWRDKYLHSSRNLGTAHFLCQYGCHSGRSVSWHVLQIIVVMVIRLHFAIELIFFILQVSFSSLPCSSFSPVYLTLILYDIVWHLD